MEISQEFSHFYSDKNMQEWLEEVFQKDDIPPFDRTPELVEILKIIKARNKASEKDVMSIIKAERNMIDFYNEKAEDLQLVTEFINLPLGTCRRLESIASLAEKMKLKEPTLTNFLLGMTEIEDINFADAEKNLINKRHLSVFSEKLQHTLKMNDKLKRYLKSLSKVVELQKTHKPKTEKELAYFEGKKKELELIKANNEGILKNVGYLENKEICHSQLIGKAQNLEDLKKREKTLEKKLQAYHSLKPNIESTYIDVQKKQAELMGLKKEFELLLQEYENS